jgi:multicomponent Na+:H+ antiporter subunit G
MILLEIIISLFLLLGSLLVVVGAIGVIRFADPLCRAHALGKASSLGICLMLAGLWMALDDEITGLKIMLVMAFSLLTIPMASHLVSLYVYNLEGLEVTVPPEEAEDMGLNNCGPNADNDPDVDVADDPIVEN